MCDFYISTIFFLSITFLSIYIMVLYLELPEPIPILKNSMSQYIGWFKTQFNDVTHFLGI